MIEHKASWEPMDSFMNPPPANLHMVEFPPTDSGEKFYLAWFKKNNKFIIRKDAEGHWYQLFQEDRD